MIKTDIARVEETTGLDMAKSENFDDLHDRILAVTPYNQWSYDYATEILTIETDSYIEGDLSTIGEVVRTWEF